MIYIKTDFKGIHPLFQAIVSLEDFTPYYIQNSYFPILNGLFHLIPKSWSKIKGIVSKMWSYQ